MSKAPPEVDPEINLVGTNLADLMFVTAAALSSHPQFNAYSQLRVSALVGDDGIVRDRTGDYDGSDGQFRDVLIDGGAGFDTLNYNGADGPITVRLDQTDASGYSTISSSPLPIASENNFVRGADRVKNIEGVAGTLFDDVMQGDGKANKLWGHDGGDVIHGNGGNDTIYGGLGDDHLYGGNGADFIDGGEGDDYVRGGAGNDTIHGGDGDDEIYGDADHDTIYAGDGNDYVSGGSGNDVIHGGDGSNDLYGGSGNDIIHLSGFGNNYVDGGTGTDTIVFTQHAVVNLYSGFAWRGPQGVEGMDTIIHVENVTTGKHDDVVIGTDVRNVIRTNGGDDFVMAMGGDDLVHAGAGDDTVYGGAGDDDIYGENGDDYLDGGDGDDMIVGGRGADRIRGGAGDDDIWLGRKHISDTDRDVLIWKEGDIGLDTVRGFNVAHDRLNFGEGFLAAGPEEDNLLVFLDGSDAMLAANIAGHGWDFIARFEDVSAIALTNAIENGSVFDVEVSDVGNGGPGGFAPADDPYAIALGVNLQIMF